MAFLRLMPTTSFLALFFALLLTLNAVAQAQKPKVDPRFCHKDSTQLTGNCEDDEACRNACLGEDRAAFTGTCLQEFSGGILQCQPAGDDAEDPADEICHRTTKKALPTKRCVCTSVCSGRPGLHL